MRHFEQFLNNVGNGSSFGVVLQSTLKLLGSLLLHAHHVLSGESTSTTTTHGPFLLERHCGITDELTKEDRK